MISCKVACFKCFRTVKKMIYIGSLNSVFLVSYCPNFLVNFDCQVVQHWCLINLWSVEFLLLWFMMMMIKTLQFPSVKALIKSQGNQDIQEWMNKISIKQRSRAHSHSLGLIWNVWDILGQHICWVTDTQWQKRWSRSQPLVTANHFSFYLLSFICYTFLIILTYGEVKS